MLVLRTSFQAILVLLATFFVPALAAEVPGPELEVEDHWLDIYQEVDRETLMVEETLWFNNTSDRTFNDTMYVWLPEDATVYSLSVEEGAAEETFMMPRFIDDHIVKFDPFADYTTLLTYYGQTEQINLTASDDNGTVMLPLQVVLKKDDSQNPANASQDDLTLSTEQDTLSASLGNQPDIPKKITVLHYLTLKNEEGLNRTLNLSVSNLPEDWVGLLFDDEGNTTITLGPGETVNLTLHLHVPSYLIKIKVGYLYTLMTTGDKVLSGQFDKELLYPTGKVEVYTYAQPTTTMTMEGGFEVTMLPPITDNQQRQWRIFRGEGNDLAVNSTFSIDLTWDKPKDPGQDSDFDWAWPVALLVIAIIFGIPMLHRSGLLRLNEDQIPEEDELDRLDEAPPEDASMADPEIERTRRELKELRDRFQLGNVPISEFTQQEWELKERLTALELETGGDRDPD